MPHIVAHAATIIIVRLMFAFFPPPALFLSSSSPIPIFPAVKISPPRAMLKLQPVLTRPISRPRPTIKAEPRALLRLARRNLPRWRYCARERIYPTELLTCRTCEKVFRFGILCLFQLQQLFVRRWRKQSQEVAVDDPQGSNFPCREVGAD